MRDIVLGLDGFGEPTANWKDFAVHEMIGVAKKEGKLNQFGSPPTNTLHVVVRLFCNRSETSKFGKNNIDALDCTSCATPLWSIDKQTHSNMELIYFIFIIKMQSNVNGDLVFASLLHLPSVGPIVRRNQNACIVTIRKERHLSRSLWKFDCQLQSLRTVFFPGTLSISIRYKSEVLYRAW